MATLRNLLVNCNETWVLSQSVWGLWCESWSGLPGLSAWMWTASQCRGAGGVCRLDLDTSALPLLCTQWGKHKEPYSALMQYSWWGVRRAVKHSRVVRRPSNPPSGSSCCLGSLPSPNACPLAEALSVSFSALPCSLSAASHSTINF